MGATERVVQFIEYKGITKYKFCKDLGFSNKFLDNSSNMGTDKACKILQHFPDLSPEWLITGNGDMLKSETILTQNNNDCSQYKELAEERAYTIQMQKEVIAKLKEENLQLKKQTKSPVFSPAPVR